MSGGIPKKRCRTKSSAFELVLVKCSHRLERLFTCSDVQTYLPSILNDLELEIQNQTSDTEAPVVSSAMSSWGTCERSARQLVNVSYTLAMPPSQPASRSNPASNSLMISSAQYSQTPTRPTPFRADSSSALVVPCESPTQIQSAAFGKEIFMQTQPSAPAILLEDPHFMHLQSQAGDLIGPFLSSEVPANVDHGVKHSCLPVRARQGRGPRCESKTAAQYTGQNGANKGGHRRYDYVDCSPASQKSLGARRMESAQDTTTSEEAVASWYCWPSEVPASRTSRGGRRVPEMRSMDLILASKFPLEP